jgi:hypothetical protein
MKKIIYIFLGLGLLFGCNKEQNVLDDINGNWEIKGFIITDYEGLQYEGTAEGNFEINSASKTYVFNLAYTTNLTEGTYNYTGNFTLIDNNKTIQLNYLKPTNELYTFKFNVIYASKEYLKLEYWDESYRLNTLLFAR